MFGNVDVNTIFSPDIDDKLLKDTTFSQKPILIGAGSDEGSYFGVKQQ
jgi:hypothetical protein